MDRTDERWRMSTATPDVARGCECEFIVAVRRAHSGKVYSFSASYLNAYPLRYDHECPKGDGCAGEGCDDGCPTTGWYRLTGDDGDAGQYHALSIGKDDEFLGWRHIPQWSAALAPTIR